MSKVDKYLTNPLPFCDYVIYGRPLDCSRILMAMGIFYVYEKLNHTCYMHN